MKKKAIVFGTDKQVREIGAILKKHDIEVIEASTKDSYQPLIEAVKKHRDVDIVILCGAALGNQILYPTQEVRRISKVPLLAVMAQRRITAPNENQMLKAGATEVLRSPNDIENEDIAMMAARTLGISIRPERKEWPSPLPRVALQSPRQSPPQLRVVPKVQTPPVAPPDKILSPLAEPVVEEASLVPKPSDDQRVDVDEMATVLLTIAERLEADVGILRQQAEEILRLVKQGQEVRSLPQDAPPQSTPQSSLFTIGEIVVRGRMVTLCGHTFHLPHQQVKILDILCRERGNGGAGKDLFYGLGIKTPVAVSVAMSGLRQRLAKILPGSGIRCQGGKYHLELPA